MNFDECWPMCSRISRRTPEILEGFEVLEKWIRAKMAILLESGKPLTREFSQCLYGSRSRWSSTEQCKQVFGVEERARVQKDALAAA